MKKTVNVLAFILIIGFIGAWDCGNCDFKTLLFNVGVTLCILFIYHFLRMCFYTSKAIRRARRHKVGRVKIY